MQGTPWRTEATARLEPHQALQAVVQSTTFVAQARVCSGQFTQVKFLRRASMVKYFSRYLWRAIKVVSHEPVRENRVASVKIIVFTEKEA